ncbi:hypothetical protein HPSAT_00845 [Helicobacter pylori Sat464]|nr:hypothetical protein HPSAT_00845 [Helicobacter pylori Sat464]
MFAADIVIIFIVFIGVSYVLFGKKKDVKEDSKFYKTMMNVISTIVAAIILCPWILMVLFYPNVFITICYSILNNFYILLVNLVFISLLCKIKGLCA